MIDYGFMMLQGQKVLKVLWSLQRKSTFEFSTLNLDNQHCSSLKEAQFLLNSWFFIYKLLKCVYSKTVW